MSLLTHRRLSSQKSSSIYLFLNPGMLLPGKLSLRLAPDLLLYQTASHAASLALARWHGWRQIPSGQTASHAASLALARWHGWRQIPSGQTTSHAISIPLAGTAGAKSLLARLPAMPSRFRSPARLAPNPFWPDYKPCCQSRSRSLARLAPYKIKRTRAGLQASLLPVLVLSILHGL